MAHSVRIVKQAARSQMEVTIRELWGLNPVAYLGFRKGGAKFSLATSAHTKEGPTKFSNFCSMSKKNFLAKGGHGPKYAFG